MAGVLPIPPPQLPFVVHVRDAGLGSFFCPLPFLSGQSVTLSVVRIPVVFCIQLVNQEQGLCCITPLSQEWL